MLKTFFYLPRNGVRNSKEINIFDICFKNEVTLPNWFADFLNFKHHICSRVESGNVGK